MIILSNVIDPAERPHHHVVVRIKNMLNFWKGVFCYEKKNIFAAVFKMVMMKILKIKPALLLCTAFIIRILFVNVGIISSLNTKQGNSLIKAHFSNVMKRRKRFEALSSSENCEYSTVEICEEDDLDNYDQFKAGYFLLTQVLHSLVAVKKESNLQKIPFYKYFSYISSGRLQVFRI